MKTAVPKLCEDLGLVDYCGGLPKFINYEIFLLALAGVVAFLWVDWMGHSRKDNKGNRARLLTFSTCISAYLQRITC